MTYYTVAEIADAFGTNQETIRRWIRGGELEAEQGSLREGKKISEASLQAFLSKHPKYASIAAKSPLLGFVASVSLGKAVLERSIIDIGSLKVSEMDEWLTIAKETLAKKELELQQLRENIAVIESMQRVIQIKNKEGGNKRENHNT
ncbi:helix-turn-helix domain-containing protein [Eubacteriales bacterium OttesenSCG-928-N13]|nr:helix-turn-helix domain-containing protein [Eubacteriales bacterium OttesenSCG-928-N13]